MNIDENYILKHGIEITGELQTRLKAYDAEQTRIFNQIGRLKHNFDLSVLQMWKEIDKKYPDANTLAQFYIILHHSENGKTVIVPTRYKSSSCKNNNENKEE